MYVAKTCSLNFLKRYTAKKVYYNELFGTLGNKTALYIIGIIHSLNFFLQIHELIDKISELINVTYLIRA